MKTPSLRDKARGLFLGDCVTKDCEACVRDAKMLDDIITEAQEDLKARALEAIDEIDPSLPVVGKITLFTRGERKLAQKAREAIKAIEI